MELTVSRPQQPTPTPAARRSIRACPQSSSSTAPQHDHCVWVLQSRYLAHHGYGVLARRPARPRPLRGSAARERRGDRPTGSSPLLDAAGVRAGGARRPQHGFAGRARLRRAPSGAREPIALLGAAFPMRVSAELLDATQERRAAGAGHGQHLVARGLRALPEQSGPGLLGDRRKPAPDAAAEARRDARRFRRLQRLRGGRGARGAGALPGAVPARRGATS